MCQPDKTWQLPCQLEFNDVTLENTLEIAEGIRAGYTLELNLDFSKYEEESIYTLTYRYTPYSKNMWTSQSEEFIRFWRVMICMLMIMIIIMCMCCKTSVGEV